MKMFRPGSRTAQGSGHHNAPALGSSVLSQHGRSSGLACEFTVVAGDGASRHAAPPEEGEEVRAVMERMALVKLARHADKTQQELEKIRTRVDHTMEAFELGNRAVMDSLKRANMECFENLEQLESFLSSSAQRRQHQQDTMLFIVGYQEKCGCRQQLLSQLSEFFDHSSILTDGDSSKDLDVDISHSTQKVQEALESTRQAMEHLGTLHSALIALTSHMGSAKEKKR
ncbi:microtubule-actin cross-linking factor 1-like [Lethenteron reissneri]|uniref:microtubule-actin cross-linking factor 1-like n=1 Tax=Lethenteron reissneri TaxID=7753 RepID=UPI002AB7AF70|nr:microtubule-actin cross-linking factor 1-like [Lethenteron reissneri]